MRRVRVVSWVVVGAIAVVSFGWNPVMTGIGALFAQDSLEDAVTLDALLQKVEGDKVKAREFLVGWIRDHEKMVIVHQRAKAAPKDSVNVDDPAFRDYTPASAKSHAKFKGMVVKGKAKYFRNNGVQLVPVYQDQYDDYLKKRALVPSHFVYLAIRFNDDTIGPYNVELNPKLDGRLIGLTYDKLGGSIALALVRADNSFRDSTYYYFADGEVGLSGGQIFRLAKERNGKIAGEEQRLDDFFIGRKLNGEDVVMLPSGEIVRAIFIDSYSQKYARHLIFYLEDPITGKVRRKIITEFYDKKDGQGNLISEGLVDWKTRLIAERDRRASQLETYRKWLEALNSESLQNPAAGGCKP